MRKTFHSTWAAWPWYVLALTLFLSCSGRSSVAPAVESYTLEREILDTAKTLKPETVDLDSPITARELYVWQDSIAVVLNGEKGGRRLVEMYSMNSGRLIKDLFIKGRGPDEILLCYASLKRDTLLVNDIMQHKIAILPLDSLLHNKNYKPTFRHYTINTQRLWPFRGRLLAVNPNCFVDKQNGINNDGPRFILSDSNYNYKETKHYEINTINLTGADFFISYEKNRIFYWNLYSPEIEIYDTDLHLLRKINGIKQDKKIEYLFANGYVYADADYEYTYRVGCYDDKYVYIISFGEAPNEDASWDDFNKSYILKFDWDGNFIDSYLIELNISSLSVSTDGQSLYAFGLDSQGNNALYKYSLP